LQSLSLVADAAFFSVNDQRTLLALAQTNENDEFGAPAPAAYKSHSDSIVEILEDEGKTEGQHSQLRKAEQIAKHNDKMLKNLLEKQISADTVDMKKNSAKAESEETVAEAKSDVEVTTKELKNSRDDRNITFTR